MDRHRSSYSIYARILLLAVPFIPLVVVNSFIFPFVTGKAFAFFLLVQCTLLLLILRQRASWTITVNVLLLLFGCFFIFATISTILSDNPHMSFWSDVERMSGLFLWAHLFAFFVATSVLFEEKHWRTFFTLSFVTSSAVSLLGIAQRNGTIPLMNEEERIDVLFGNPVFLSLYLLFHIGIGLLLLVRARSSHIRPLISLFLGIHVLVLFYTGTRGSLLGFLGAVAVGCILYAVHAAGSPRVRYACIGAVVTILAAFGTLLLFNDHPLIASQPMLERFSVISLSNLQNQARYFLWEAALDGIAEHPMWGSGFESFVTTFSVFVEPSYFGNNLSSLPEPWTDRAHNIFLDVGSSTGLLSLVVFLMIGFYTTFIFYSTKRLSEQERIILIATITAYVIHSLFSFNTLTDFVLLIALAAYANSLDERRGVEMLTVHQNVVVPFKILGATAVILGLVTTGNRAFFSVELRAVLDSTPEQTFEEFVEHAELSRRHFIDRHYLFSELPFVGMRVLATETVSEEERREMIRAVQEAERSSRALGHLSFKDQYFFGQFYRMSGAYTDAVRIFAEAHAQAPQNQFILIALGDLAISEGRYGEALAYFERAYFLEPTFEEVVVRYANVLVHEGQADEAEAVIQRYFDATGKSIELMSKDGKRTL